MKGSRAGALERARSVFDDGTFVARLEKLVAVPTESQASDGLRRLSSSGRSGPLLAEPRLRNRGTRRPAHRPHRCWSACAWKMHRCRQC